MESNGDGEENDFEGFENPESADLSGYGLENGFGDENLDTTAADSHANDLSDICMNGNADSDAEEEEVEEEDSFNEANTKKTKKNNNKKGKKKNRFEGCCVLCNSKEEDVKLCGNLHRTLDKKLICHEFCLLFACNLVQDEQIVGESESESEDSSDSEVEEKDDGDAKKYPVIKGFSNKSIEREVRRGSRLTCHFCKKKGATVGCSEESCKIGYHLSCGRLNEVVVLFTGTYPSYCEDHIPKFWMDDETDAKLKKLRKLFPLQFRFPSFELCPICEEPVERRASRTVFRTTCCRKSNGEQIIRYYHVDCVQGQAIAYGMYHIACSFCKDKDEYKKTLQLWGLHIPHKDAAWEDQNDPFYEGFQGHERRGHCYLEDKCQNFGKEGGVEFDHRDDFHPFCIIFCALCGQHRSVHRLCGGLEVEPGLEKTPADPAVGWKCPDCLEFETAVAAPEGVVEGVVALPAANGVAERNVAMDTISGLNGNLEDAATNDTAAAIIPAPNGHAHANGPADLEPRTSSPVGSAATSSGAGTSGQHVKEPPPERGLAYDSDESSEDKVPLKRLAEAASSAGGEAKKQKTSSAYAFDRAALLRLRLQQ